MLPFYRGHPCKWYLSGCALLQVLMAAGDHAGLIEACAHLGDVSRGGDPHLWTEVLQYFGSQQYDCSAQVAPLPTFRHDIFESCPDYLWIT